MSKYSEMMGSFIRTGNYPLEADYIFSSENELISFYSENNNPENAAILHEGLLKVVKTDTNQTLYWVVEENGELKFVKLINDFDITNIKNLLLDLYTLLETEIQHREEGDILIWGTDDISLIPLDYNSILKIANALEELLSLLNTVKSELKATVGTTEDDIVKYLETLDYKNLTEVSEALNKFLNTIDETNSEINTLPELKEFLRGFEYTHNLYECFVDFWNNIQGSPTPNTLFRTLRGILDFVEALSSITTNRDNNLQKELDLTQIGIGLSGDGSYSADLETVYLKNATSVMNALKTLDSLINQAINNCNLLSKETNTATVDIVKMSDKTTVAVNVKVSSLSNNDIISKNDGIYHNIDFELQNGILTVYSNGNVKKQLSLGASSVVEDAYYDVSSESIVIKFKLLSGDIQKVIIPATGLIDELLIDNSIPDKVVVLEKQRNTQGSDLLSADIRLSSKQDNILEKDNNTLYVGGNAENIRYGTSNVKDVLDSITSSEELIKGSMLSMMFITQEEYDLLETKESNVCYAVVNNGKITKMYTGSYEWDLCNLWATEPDSSDLIYYGYILDNSVTLFSDITYQIVQNAISNGTISTTEIDSLEKTSLGNVPEAAWIVVLIPSTSSLVATKDDGIGGKVAFDESFMGSNGSTVVSLKYTDYKVYGEYAIISGERFIYIN